MYYFKEYINQKLLNAVITLKNGKEVTISELIKLYKNDTEFESKHKRTKDGKFTDMDGNNHSYKEAIKSFMRGEQKSGSLITVGKLPSIFFDKKIGLHDYPVKLPSKVIPKSTKYKHDVKQETIENLPELLEHPVMILSSRTVPGSVVTVIDATDKSGRPVLVILKEIKNQIILIPSVYGRNDFEEFVITNLEQGNVKYIDKKKALKSDQKG